MVRDMDVLDSLSSLAPHENSAHEATAAPPTFEPRYVCVMTANHPLKSSDQSKDCRIDSSCGSYMGSDKLLKTNYHHGPNTTWLVRVIHGIPSDLPQALVRTLKIRFQRHGLEYRRHNTTQSLVNRILEEDGFSLVMVDSHDTANPNLHGYMVGKIRPLIGWRHSYLITRSTTSSPYRNMAPYNKLPWNTTFTPESLGGVANFTRWVGRAYRGVKHYTYPIRNDLLHSLNTTLQARQKLPSSNTTTTVQDPFVHFVGRTKDVMSLWKPGDVSYASNLRSAVSEAVQEVGRRRDWNYWTNKIGYSGAEGRSKIHPGYVHALLGFKVVVLCQRDFYEDHIRLFEAMISGALVFSDPMRDFPRGLVDGQSIVVYHSLEDLQQKLVYYLEHDKERQEIATRGRQVSLEQHRSWHRWEALLLDDWSVKDNNSISILD